MAILSGGPLSSLPISAQAEAGAPPPPDESIATQTTRFPEGFDGYDDEVSGGYDTGGFIMSPLEDVVFVEDVTIFPFPGFYDLITDDDANGYQPEWSRGPPTDQFDETGETTGETSNNDFTDGDAPIADGHFSTPPISDDEYVRTPACAAMFDCCAFCENEPPTEGFVSSPLEDAPVATVDDVLPQELGQVYDEDEPVTDGFVSEPPDDVPVVTIDDTGPQELGQVYDDDEPVTDGWLQSVPTDQFDETGQTTGEWSNNDWVDEAEPIVEGWVWFQPDEAVPVLNADVTGTSFADIYDNDEPVTEGWFTAPLQDGPAANEVVPQELGQVWASDEPVTDGFTLSALEDAPQANADITGTCLPEDDDLDGLAFHPDFFSGFIMSPAEDTPEVVPQTTGLWYDLKKKRKRRIIPAWEDDEEEVVEGPAEQAPEPSQEPARDASIATRLLGPRGRNTPLPVPVIKSTGFVPMDTQGWSLLISGVLQSRSIAEAEARNEAIRNEFSRRAADIILRAEVETWKKFQQDFQNARIAREKQSEMEEIAIIKAIWELVK